MPVARRCAELAEAELGRQIVVADAASTLLYAGETAASRRLFERAVTRSRAAGAMSDLGYALHMSAQLEWYSGNLQRAYAQALEAVQIVEALGTAQMLDDCLSRLATFEAVLGRERDSRLHATRALEAATAARRSPQRGSGARCPRALGPDNGRSRGSCVTARAGRRGAGGRRPSQPQSDTSRTRSGRGVRPTRRPGQGSNRERDRARGHASAHGNRMDTRCCEALPRAGHGG